MRHKFTRCLLICACVRAGSKQCFRGDNRVTPSSITFAELSKGKIKGARVWEPNLYHRLMSGAPAGRTTRGPELKPRREHSRAITDEFVT